MTMNRAEKEIVNLEEIMDIMRRAHHMTEMLGYKL